MEDMLWDKMKNNENRLPKTPFRGAESVYIGE